MLVAFVHGYNLSERYLQPFTIVQERLSITSSTEYWFSNGLIRFMIPLLFMISGYLYALGDDNPYKSRIKKRVSTLLVPYLIWSAFALAFTYYLQQFPITTQALKDAQLDQLGDNRPYNLFTWKDLLLRWTLFPIAFQLWFLKCLFIYNLAYPLFVKALAKFPAIWFGSCIFLWLVTFGCPLMEGEGLLFFSLGIYVQKRAFNIREYNKWLNPKLWFGVCIIASVAKTILAFHFGWSVGSFITLSLLHKLTVFSGLVTVWFGGDKLVTFFMKRQWFVRLCYYSFFIYLIHVPFSNYATCFIFRYVPHFYGYRLITFLFLPISIVLFAVILASFFKLITPKLFSFCTGGRG